MCESLILGEIPCTPMAPLDANFENNFRHQWGERLAQFDDVISQYHPQDKLFEQVIICGNLYAICKKLENLLRTSGLSEIIKQIHENDMATKDAINNAKNDTPRINLTVSADDFESNRDMQERTYTNPSDHQVPTPRSELLHDQGDGNRSEDIQTNTSEKDVSDDDDALLPCSNDVFTPEETTQSQATMSLALPPKPVGKAPRLPQTKSNRRLTKTLSKSQLKVSDQTEKSDSKGDTTIFHNIAELFPAVQTLLRTLQKSG